MFEKIKERLNFRIGQFQTFYVSTSVQRFETLSLFRRVTISNECRPFFQLSWAAELQRVNRRRLRKHDGGVLNTSGIHTVAKNNIDENE